MEPIRRTNNNSLIVAVVILALLGVMAYVLLTNSVSDQESEEVTTTSQTSEQDLMAARAEVATVLSEIQASINAGANISTSDVNQKLVNERRELRTAYQNVTGEARAEYEEIDRNLGRLETELKGDVKVASATILSTMSKIESDMQADVRATWEEIKRASASLDARINERDEDIEVNATTSAEVR